MEEFDTDFYLQYVIEEYLLGHGALDMEDIIDDQPDCIEFAEIHDILGINKQLVQLQTQYIPFFHSHLCLTFHLG